MLSLNQMLEMWERDCGAPLPVALDRLDNVDHRGSYDGPALPENYTPESGERTVRVELGYECGPDGDVRIIQR